MKLFGQIVGWSIVAVGVVAILMAAVIATLPPVVHP